MTAFSKRKKEKKICVLLLTQQLPFECAAVPFSTTNAVEPKYPVSIYISLFPSSTLSTRVDRHHQRFHHRGRSPLFFFFSPFLFFVLNNVLFLVCVLASFPAVYVHASHRNDKSLQHVLVFSPWCVYVPLVRCCNSATATFPFNFQSSRPPVYIPVKCLLIPHCPSSTHEFQSSFVSAPHIPSKSREDRQLQHAHYKKKHQICYPLSFPHCVRRCTRMYACIASDIFARLIYLLCCVPLPLPAPSIGPSRSHDHQNINAQDHANNQLSSTVLPTTICRQLCTSPSLTH